MSPLEEAVARGEGITVLELDRPGGGEHRHSLRVKRVDFPQWECCDYYVEVTEPGACGCVRRVVLSALIHALMNAGDAGLGEMEAREVCACGHRHHLDDAGGEAQP